MTRTRENSIGYNSDYTRFGFHLSTYHTGGGGGEQRGGVYNKEKPNSIRFLKKEIAHKKQGRLRHHLYIVSGSAHRKKITNPLSKKLPHPIHDIIDHEHKAHANATTKKGFNG